MIGICAVAVLGTGCVKSMAVNALGDALAREGGTYARDDDPELVRDATAFGLKTIETLLDAEPTHPGLLLAAARGFTQYGYAFLQAEADYVEADDYARAKVLRARALRMYRRARAYGLRGLSVAVEDFEARLGAEPQETLAALSGAHVGLIYWTAAAWAAAVALVLGRPLEEHLRVSLVASKGEIDIFFTSPFSLFFLAMAAASIFWSLSAEHRAKKAARNSMENKQ